VTAGSSLRSESFGQRGPTSADRARSSPSQPAGETRLGTISGGLRNLRPGQPGLAPLGLERGRLLRPTCGPTSALLARARFSARRIGVRTGMCACDVRRRVCCGASTHSMRPSTRKRGGGDERFQATSAAESAPTSADRQRCPIRSKRRSNDVR
jgi:hypothetical protein